MLKRAHSITNDWFYTELPFIVKTTSFIFIRGDLIFLLPLYIGIIIIGFFSLKFMFIMLGAYIALRNFFEVIYWMLHQFGPNTYRPGDMGFHKLKNNAIYILYQTVAMVWVLIGTGIVLFALLKK